MMRFKAKALPYTMGNSGDLIKHGLLSEFIGWWCQLIRTPLDYYDPFGGRPWQEPVHFLVKKRLIGLNNGFLHHSFDGERYLGSGQLVKHLVAARNAKVGIFCSDRDKDARQDLELSGLEMIALDGFNHQDAYSILDCKLSNTARHCIMLDPYDELERINEQILPKIMNKVIDELCYVFLFVIFQAKELSLWQNFQEKQGELLGASVSYLSLSCPPLVDRKMVDSEIAGESKFYSHIVLYIPKGHTQPSPASLVKNVEKYALNLQRVLNSPVSFNYRA